MIVLLFHSVNQSFIFKFHHTVSWPVQPNLPDPVNFVPFGTIRYSISDINLMRITCIKFVYNCVCFLIKLRHSSLQWYMACLDTHYFNLHKCDWLQMDNEHPQNGSGKLGLNTGWVKKTAIIMKGEIKDRHNTLIYSKSNLCTRLF